jgi:hypothetical protein
VTRSSAGNPAALVLIFSTMITAFLVLDDARTPPDPGYHLDEFLDLVAAAFRRTGPRA